MMKRMILTKVKFENVNDLVKMMMKFNDCDHK